MYPTLFTLGSFQIRASVFFLTLAVITAIIVGRKEALRVGLQQKGIQIFFLSVIPLGLLFGYINGLIFDIGFLDALDILEHALIQWAGFVWRYSGRIPVELHTKQDS